jgi:hypothetical protein
MVFLQFLNSFHYNITLLLHRYFGRALLSKNLDWWSEDLALGDMVAWERRAIQLRTGNN